MKNATSLQFTDNFLTYHTDPEYETQYYYMNMTNQMLWVLSGDGGGGLIEVKREV